MNPRQMKCLTLDEAEEWFASLGVTMRGASSACLSRDTRKDSVLSYHRISKGCTKAELFLYSFNGLVAK